jgi:hypothetical protein
MLNKEELIKMMEILRSLDLESTEYSILYLMIADRTPKELEMLRMCLLPVVEETY